jgi:uncharacterized protein YoxC
MKPTHFEFQFCCDSGLNNSPANSRLPSIDFDNFCDYVVSMPDVGFYKIIAALALLIFFAVMFYVIRLIREVIPTLRQVRRMIRELQFTIRNSQEILYNVKSITQTVDQEVKDLQEVVGAARGIVHQVHSVTNAITKPVSSLRSVLSGIGYGVKYLVKGDREYQAIYEDDLQ